MKNGICQEHWTDAKGDPGGGVSSGRGISILWQRGPLGRANERKEPNGAFVEDVIDAVIGRIEFFQKSRFACDENEQTLTYLREAAEALELRTRKREERGVEGTQTKTKVKVKIGSEEDDE